MNKKSYLLIIILIISFAGIKTAWAQSVTFQAEVDKPQVALDDQLTLTLSVSGEGMSGLPEPELPPLNDFTVQGPSVSSQISIVNMRASSSKTFSYTLTPKRQGRFTIGSAILKDKGLVYKTRPIQVEVTAAGSGSINPRSNRRSGRGFGQAPGNPFDMDNFFRPRERRRLKEDDLSIRLELAPREVYVGQEIVLSFDYYQGINEASPRGPKLPDLKGFWVEDISDFNDDQGKLTELNGRQYMVRNIFRKALYPLQPGVYNLDPAELRVVTDSFFGEETTLRSEPATIKVKPLPPSGRPPDFSGLVGHFNISASLEPQSAAVNDSLKLKMTISGRGNLKNLLKLKFSAPANLDSFDPEISEDRHVENGKLVTAKTFTYVLIPRAAGNYQLPAFDLNFFDPESNAYRTLKTELISFSVAPGKPGAPVTPVVRETPTQNEVKALTKDINYIKPPPGELDDWGRPAWERGYFWTLVLIPILADIAALLWRIWTRRREMDTAGTRRSRAGKQAEKRLREAAKLLSTGSDKDFYAALDQALRRFLADRLNIGAAAFSLNDFMEAKGQVLGKETKELLSEIWRRLELLQFAPTASTPEQKEADLTRLKQVIRMMEKEL